MKHAFPQLAALIVAACALAGASLAQQSFERPRADRRDAERGAERGETYGPGGRAFGAAPMPRRDERPNSLGADWRQQQEEARSAVRQGQMAPLGRVIEGIGRRSPGRQLDAGIEYQDGRPVYRVRWMTANGRRVDYIVDAASGTILSGQ